MSPWSASSSNELENKQQVCITTPIDSTPQQQAPPSYIGSAPSLEPTIPEEDLLDDLPFPEFADRAFYCITQHNRLRRICIGFVNNPYVYDGQRDLPRSTYRLQFLMRFGISLRRTPSIRNAHLGQISA